VDKHLGRNGNILSVSTFCSISLTEPLKFRQNKKQGKENEQEHTAISKAKYLVADLEIINPCAQALHHAGEFDSKGLGCLRRDRVLSLTLKQIHAVQTECADLDESLAGGGAGLGDLIDEQGCRGAFAALDSYIEL